MLKTISKQLIEKRFLIVVLLSVAFFIASMENAIISSASFPPEFYLDEKFSWKVDNISSGITLWYNVSDYSPITTWYANKNDILSFNLTNWKQVDEQNYLIGNLMLGNLTIKTDNQDIGFNLVLSIYPWFGGLVALEQDWNGLSEIMPFVNNDNVEINYNKLVTILNQQVEAIEIKYDDGFQKTNLLYEPITGILISTNTSSGSFWLEMHLNSSTIPLPNISQNIGFKSFAIFLNMSAVILFQKTKRAN
ncbi:MAG: hypothetical protein JXA54_05300 [Candidatus Heimdallarchaeota archaeon]|nr:hypothetical protein [Candidatus Heimdallarchaeota archaeon]